MQMNVQTWNMAQLFSLRRNPPAKHVIKVGCVRISTVYQRIWVIGLLYNSWFVFVILTVLLPIARRPNNSVDFHAAFYAWFLPLNDQVVGVVEAPQVESTTKKITPFDAVCIIWHGELDSLCSIQGLFMTWSQPRTESWQLTEPKVCRIICS